MVLESSQEYIWGEISEEKNDLELPHVTDRQQTEYKAKHRALNISFLFKIHTLCFIIDYADIPYNFYEFLEVTKKWPLLGC